MKAGVHPSLLCGIGGESEGRRGRKAEGKESKQLQHLAMAVSYVPKLGLGAL